MTNDDMELVRQYAANQSESAFAALVSRHANLVYSAALRRTGNPQLAEEITQAVFIILARKAGSLNENTIISGWLYRTACYVSGHAFKQELRRQQREQESYMQSLSNQTESEVWPQIMPLLEEAMLRLGQTDRDALVLHFFEGRNLKEVGTILGASEGATKMRVNRAVEKLRLFFTKRGVVVPAAALTAAMAANSVQAAPTALAKTATAIAIAKGATASGSTLTLIKGALKIMAWSKAKTAIVVGAGILLVAGTATVAVVQHQTGDKSPGKADTRSRADIRSQMVAIKTSVIPAVYQYAQEHQDEIPARLSDLKPYLPENIQTGMDDDHWEILASGKLTPLLRRNDVILLQEKNVPAGRLKIVGYTDGHIASEK